MNRYTPQQRAVIIEIYFTKNRSIIETQRGFRSKYGSLQVPTAQTIRRLITRFKHTGTTADRRHTGRVRTSRSLENIARVEANVEEAPETSVRRRSASLGIPRSSLHRIMRTDLRLFPYKIQLVQELRAGDTQTRLTYCEELLNLNAEDSDFSSKLLMSDEAHFELNGAVNKQNCRFWGRTNPRQIYERPLHPRKVTVWCGVTSQYVLGPYFFQNESGEAVTVNAERYRTMIRDFLVPEIHRLRLENIWFQQDGATAHTARLSMEMLRGIFPNRLISKYGDLNWPARSPDLTAPDFFLWGFLKSKVYINKPDTLQHLKQNIRDEIANILPETLRSVIENAIERTRICQCNDGGHLLDIIF